MRYTEEYECKHCQGVSRITIVKDTEKATEPTIEFCPFCGMVNHYPVESDGECAKEQQNEVH